jgi:hypothetical protein
MRSQIANPDPQTTQRNSPLPRPKSQAKGARHLILRERLPEPEETLVTDARSKVRPAENVENKLRRILRLTARGVSLLRFESRVPRRNGT